MNGLKRIQSICDGIILYFSLKGLSLPGLKGARTRLTPDHLAAIDRQILVREIKGSRALLGQGPLGVRRMRGGIETFFLHYRGIVGLLLKILAGSIVILLPIVTFVIVRGILPVPTRVPFIEPSVVLPHVSVLKTVWPYTNSETAVADAPEIVNYILSGQARGTQVSLDSDSGTIPGLVRFSVGDYPSRVREFRGFLVSENAGVTVPRLSNFGAEVLGRNKLLVWTHLLPAQESLSRCRLEIRDDEGKLLVASEAESVRKTSLSQPTLGTQFRERLLPASFSRGDAIQEFAIDLDRLPKALHLQVFRVGENGFDDADSHYTFLSKTEISRVAPQWLNVSSRVRDVSRGACVYGVGRFAYEKQLVRPSGRRGIVFVVVDGLRQKLVSRADLMPNLARFISERGVAFQKHFAQGNEVAFAMPPLWTSRAVRDFSTSYSDESLLRPKLGGLKHVAKLIQGSGYRTSAIGHVSDEDTSAWEDVTIVENRHYETRTITEEAGNWLAANGDAPFFLYLHYGTLRSPFRPPFEDISVLRFLRSPFGLAADQALEEGLARFWDKEFAHILMKLESFGIAHDVDIFVIGAHGNQMTPLHYDGIIQNSERSLSVTRSRSVLTQDEMNVGFISSIAGISQHKTINETTAHIDIAPTLAHLVGASAPLNNVWSGIDVFPNISGQPNEALQKRPWIYTEGLRYAAITSTKENSKKYVRQFEADQAVFFQQAFPWRHSQTWNVGEIYSNTDSLGEEKLSLIPLDSGESVLRRTFYDVAPVEKRLVVKARRDGRVEQRFEFDLDSDGHVDFDRKLSALQVQKRRVGSHLILFITGRLLAEQSFGVRWKKARAESVELGAGQKVAVCDNRMMLSAGEFLSELQNPSCLFSPKSRSQSGARDKDQDWFLSAELEVVGWETKVEQEAINPN